MLATALGLTYLGVVLCYLASPSAASDPAAATVGSALGFRVGGGGLLVLGLGGALVARPVTDGLLVWGSMAMTAGSLVVIAAPLSDRFVPVSSALALVMVVLGLWA